ncbi:hypothetical protein Tco_0753484 [Tanacetum coccineum]
MQAAQDRQKSYADRKRKPMEFEVGDRVMLKVSPWKGVVRFGKRGKLNPRYVGPFKVLAKVGKVAYRLELPQELSRVHHTFHVSNLKKCYADEPLVMPLEGIHVDDKLQFVEEPVEIMEREIKRLKRSRIPLVKVRWNSRRGPEFTWEREDSGLFTQLSQDLPLWKRSRGTSELVEDAEKEDEEEEEEEDEEVEGPCMRVESLGLGWDEAVPEVQQRAATVVETAIGQGSGSVPEPERPEIVSALRQPTLTTWIDPEDGRAYIDVPAYLPPAPPVQTPPSPEWSSGSLPISPAPSTIPSPISSPMIPLTILSQVASPLRLNLRDF